MRARGIVVSSFLAALSLALFAGLRESARGADKIVAASSQPAPTAVAIAAPPAPVKSRKIDFNRDIRPIFSDNCYFCHGPDKNRRKADLRLDTKEGLFTAKDDVFPVVAGKPDDSLLLHADHVR